MLCLAGSICWLASLEVTGDTSKRARGCGNLPAVESVACWKRQAPGTSPISPDRPLMPLDETGQFTFFAVSLRGTRTRARWSDLRLVGWRRIVGMKRRRRLLSRAPYPGYLGCCYLFGSHTSLPPKAHAAGRKLPPYYLGSRWRTSRSGPKGRYAGSYKVFVAWPLLLESPNWDVSWFQSLIFISLASGITTPLHRLCIFS